MSRAEDRGPLRRGAKLAEHRIVGFIGEGPACFVYEAAPPNDPENVALKVLRPELAVQPEWAEYFLRGADLLTRVRHPNALPVLAFGTDRDLPYATMRFQGLRSLSWVMFNEGVMQNTVSDVTRTVAEVALYCHTLAPQPLYLYAVRPSDVFVPARGRIMIADMSLGKAPGLEAPESEEPPSVGPIGCMAPELLRGAPPTIQSDIYSIGLLLLRMVRGPAAAQAIAKRLFDGEPIAELLPPRGKANINRVLVGCLASEPSERFADVLDLLAELEEKPRDSLMARLGVGHLPWVTGTIASSAIVPPARDAQLARAPAPTAVEATKADVVSGRAPEGATVPVGVQAPSTDGDGRSAVRAVGPNARDAVTTAAGYEEDSARWEPGPGRTASLDVAVRPVGRVPATRGRIFGTVAVAGTREPVAGATVACGDLACVTSEEGDFAIGDIEPGVCTLRVAASGYAGKAVDVKVLAGEATELLVELGRVQEGSLPDAALAPAARAAAPDLPVEPEPAASYVQGYVTDAATGFPLAGVTVAVGGHLAATDEMGAYSLAGIQPGRYTARFELEGYEPHAESIIAETGSLCELDVELCQEVPASPDTCTVTGIVTDSSSGAPIADVVVSIRSQSTKTDADGRFRLTLLEPGLHTLRFTAEGYQKLSASVSTQAGSAHERDVALHPIAGVIRGVVRDGRTGEPLSGATVRVGGLAAVTDPVGQYVLPGVRSGRRVVVFSARGYVEHAESADVEAGAAGLLDVELVPASGGVCGSVYDELSGSPLQGVEVSCGGATAKTDAGGEYMISDLAVGEHTLSLHLSGYGPATVAVTVEEDVETRLDVLLRPLPGVVSVTLLDAHTGQPLGAGRGTVLGSQAVADGSGRIVFEGVPPGEHTVEVSADDREPSSLAVTVQPGATVEVEIPLISLVGSVTGSVQDPVAACPVEGVEVSVVGALPKCLTDESGAYDLQRVPKGHSTIRFSRVGYDSTYAEIEVLPGQAVGHDVMLLHSASCAIGPKAVMEAEEELLRKLCARAAQAVALWPDEGLPNGSSQAVAPPPIALPEVVGGPSRYAALMLDEVAGDSILTVRRRSRGSSRYTRLAAVERAAADAVSKQPEAESAAARAAVRRSRHLGTLPLADFSAADEVIEAVPSGGGRLARVSGVVGPRAPAHVPEAQDLVIDVSGSAGGPPLEYTRGLPASLGSEGAPSGDVDLIRIEISPDVERTALLDMIREVKQARDADAASENEVAVAEIRQFLEELEALAQVDGGDPALLDALRHWSQIGRSACRAVDSDAAARRGLAALFGLLAEWVIGQDSSALTPREAKARARLVEMLGDLAESLAPRVQRNGGS